MTLSTRIPIDIPVPIDPTVGDDQQGTSSEGSTAQCHFRLPFNRTCASGLVGDIAVGHLVPITDALDPLSWLTSLIGVELRKTSLNIIMHMCTHPSLGMLRIVSFDT